MAGRAKCGFTAQVNWTVIPRRKGPMHATLDEIRQHYREVLAVNDRQRVCCNPTYPREEVPSEISIHSLSILEPLAKYEVKPNDKILDVGCGAGADCFLAAKRVGPGGRVHGIEVVDELVARANELKNKYGMENVEISAALVPPIPFGSEFFDLVMMNYSFHLFEDKAGLLHEIYGVLKNGAAAVIADSFTPKKSEEIESWLYSAAGAVSETEFKRMAAVSGFGKVEFSRVEMPGNSPDEVVGYMVCRKTR